MYLQLYWAIKIDREKKLEAGRSLLSLTQKKRKHPSFAAMITETKQLCPSCLPCVTEKHRVKAKFLTHLDSFSQTYIPNHYLTAPELSLLITKKGTRRLKGKSHEEMRNES